MPTCPNCKSETDLIDYWETGQIEFGGNINRSGWAFMQDRERNFQCPNCHIPFDAHELDKLGVTEELR